MIHFLLKEIRALSFSCASSSSVAINRRGRRTHKSCYNPELNQKHSTKSSLPGEEELTSPANSSRYLLDHNKFLQSDTSSFFLEHKSEFSRSRCNGSNRTSLTSPGDQVVVLRVSLHCKGCEGKVKKHISKMEGVRSFSVDLATKKVTVMGDVTPLEVLNSITKVKNAHLIFPPPPPPLETF